MLRFAARSLSSTSPACLQIAQAQRLYSEEGQERVVEPVPESTGNAEPEPSNKPRPFNGINKAIILGTVGNTPKSTKLTTGNVLATFSVATNSTYKDEKSGEWKKLTEWHDILVSNTNLADYVGRVVTKGMRIYLEGTIKTKVSTDQNGVQIRRKQIVVGGRNSELQIVKYSDAHTPLKEDEDDVF